MGWLSDIGKAIAGRLWQAFVGIGHTLDVRLCTSPHVFVAVGNRIVSPTQVSPHLDVKLEVWSKGGPDVSIVRWRFDRDELYKPGVPPKGDFVLEKSGKKLTLEWRLHPKTEPLLVKVGDTFGLTLMLSNDIPKRFTTNVTLAE